MRTDYSWAGSFFGYYSHYYSTISASGYYSNDKTYFMQSNLFDKASQELMFSVQSEIFNPSSLPSFSRTYISTLMKQLEKAKLLKKITDKNFNYAKTNSTQMVGGAGPGDHIDHPEHLYFQ
jgi:hypothetical protein